MIFVTVGNHFQGFERLLRKIDEISPRIPNKIIIQKGYSKYVPQKTAYFDFVPMNTAMEYIQKSDLVISHAGIGTIILCKEYGIPLIIFPRRKKYGEHSNDHQMEIAEVLLERRDRSIHIALEENELEEKIMEVLTCEERGFIFPTENVGKNNLVREIKKFINSIP